MCSSYIVLIVMTLIILRHLQVNSVKDISLHKTIAEFASIISYNVHNIVLLIIKGQFRMTTPRRFERIDDILELVSHIQRTFKKVSEPQHLLVLSLFIVPHNSHSNVLLSYHSFNSLGDGHFVI